MMHPTREPARRRPNLRPRRLECAAGRRPGSAEIGRGVNGRSPSCDDVDLNHPARTRSTGAGSAIPPSLFRLGLAVSERPSDQRMIADRPLRLRGHALAPLGEIEPLFRQLQQAALVDSGCGFVRAVDHFGGG
jgi:hypothetical protein